jgi:lipopolysaccharide transport system ATP-binding protein
MGEIAVRVENLSKRYRIGGPQARYKTLRETLVDMARAPAQQLRRLGQPSPENQTIWALKDVTFEVKRGEVLGVIGRNGAGKTTLLRILSRITEPTEGHAEIKGRVGSLLEVGTGFHPELTGRENIYLNGAILGMRRAEIDQKFDEIVAFSEIEKFLDTPVKRYSSGMYVRLAFSVAAHLEPEILLVDEVLAVGDAAFQKKCLGKMGDVAGEGRTVLFVSHNMAAVQNLCPRSLLLASGKVDLDGQTADVIEGYMQSLKDRIGLQLADRKDRRGEGQVRFTLVELLDEEHTPIEHAISGRKLIVRLHYKADTPRQFRNSRASISINAYGKPYFLASTELARSDELVLDGEGHLDCVIDQLPLSKGEYQINPFLECNRTIQDWVEAAATLSVVDGDFYGTGRSYPPGWEGKTVLVKHHWEW